MQNIAEAIDQAELHIRAGAVIDEISMSRRAWQRENRRPRALTSREALAALEFESLLVCVAAGNLANGIELTEEDRHRLYLAHQRISVIAEEAR